MPTLPEVLAQVDTIATDVAAKHAETSIARRRSPGVDGRAGGGRPARPGSAPASAASGSGPRAAALVVERTRARVRLDRDGRVHALLGRRGAREARAGEVRAGDRRRQAPHHARVLRGRLAQPVLGAGRHREPAATASRSTARKSLVTSAQPRRQLRVVEQAGRRRARRARCGSCRAARPRRAGRPAAFDGLGLRGNDSSPVTAEARDRPGDRAARRRRRGLRA